MLKKIWNHKITIGDLVAMCIPSLVIAGAECLIAYQALKPSKKVPDGKQNEISSEEVKVD